MGMNVACQHLLRRRDLSCTKVNAVNRLSNCLDTSFRLERERERERKREAAPLAAASPWARPTSAELVGQTWLAGQWGQDK